MQAQPAPGPLELDGAEEEKARKKHQRRMTSMLAFLVILAIPVGLGAWRLWRIHRDIQVRRAWAEAELAKPQPQPGAYGALGSILLDAGELEKALPLLQKAAQIESSGARLDTRDTLTLAKAHSLAAAKGLPGASTSSASAALDAAEARAAKLPTGRAAATYFSAGLLRGQLGQRAQAQAALKRAVDLQPDDWVDEGGGVRYKQRGLASYYQKMYGAALMD